MNRALQRRRVRVASGGGGGAPVSDVPLTFSRLASGTASTVLTGAVPLAPGDLPVGGNVALYVGGAEIAAYLTPVGKPHADGSARALRVQTTQSMTFGSDTTATLKLGTPQTLTAGYTAPTFATMTAVVGTWQAEAPIPGIVVSTDSTRTCASGLLGPLTVRPGSFGGAPSWMSSLESRWDSVHNAKYDQYAGVAAFAAYSQYDPTYQNLVRWARTGSVSAYKQALRVWGVRRSEYYAPNFFNIPSYLMHQRGVANAVVLFADDTARTQHFSQVSSALCSTGGYMWTYQQINSSDVSDARTAAGVILALIALDQSGDGATVVNGSTVREWIRAWTLRILGGPQWVSEATGQKSYKSQTDTSGNPGSGTPAWSNNFQNGLLCEAMADAHDNYLTDATEKTNVKTRITETMEWMWQTQFFAQGSVSALTPAGSPAAFQSLASRVVTGYSSNFPEYSVDLHMLWAGAMMWLASNVNRSTWQTRVDTMLDVVGSSSRAMDGINGPYMDPSITTNVAGKVCNENFLYMGRILAWRA